ncbi:hypothetical protein [Neorhizobium sp. NCHU2750]|uniref:hypothetical protein n=1 Tax=Neorhizobium sp. NCHU2750 TaxID=1825976 RepID=UPI000EB6CA2F|nr:hypothetical protein NCHU2750_08060 [Neorhizobium sp. NCHU2750]
MEKLPRYLHVPCGFSRMLLMSALISVASLVTGNGLWWSLGFGFASLVLMQIGYFGALLLVVRRENQSVESRLAEARVPDAGFAEVRLTEARLTEGRFAESRFVDARLADGSLGEARQPD